MKHAQVADIWLTKKIYDDAEIAYFENASKASLTPLAQEVAKARQKLCESLDSLSIGVHSTSSINADEFKALEARVGEVEKTVRLIFDNLKSISERLTSAEKHNASAKSMHEIDLKKQPQIQESAKNDDDDDIDLFGSDSDEESAEAAKIREERLAAYAAKKSKKPALIAKSNIILDVKPWDDETDMKEMEKKVRTIETEGLLWGASKLVPLAYGINKLQISCVVEDDKVSIDWLTEQIEAFEDFVQSVDIAAFNKI